MIILIAIGVVVFIVGIIKIISSYREIAFSEMNRVSGFCCLLVSALIFCVGGLSAIPENETNY